jgi:DNA-binding response OmpR family regulator
MSGYTDRINEIEQSDLPLLRKPFTPDVLAMRIRELLKSSQATCATPVR